ncbi:unnamed protein product [Rotaria socialis]|uniref:G-protein coupled receptors family 1 profile domain-containing protein n=2 Tax=Rotaria socialis TaxID=392032 RepID=A0A819YMU7_9BILA|nr:unnamed protein product [Rotaria socialis]CAF4299075.1 unnamed protein product [Rotaria socialis]CAF4549792.1 unnamed protein product [Rotaria socialis]
MPMELQAQEIPDISQNYTNCFSTNSRSFRMKQSAFYLIAESIVISIHLLVFFTSRIVINGFNNDLTQRSIVWCKLRQSFGTSFTLISLSIVCFATIDQYLSTNYNPFLKQLSTLKFARRLTCGAVIVWLAHGIPFIVFMKILPVYGCTTYYDGFNTYVTYIYYLILSGLLPIVIMSIFATLAYINVRRIVKSRIAIFRRRLDRQLTAMILARVAFLVAVTLPYIIDRIYIIQVQLTQIDPVQKATLQLAGAVAYSLFYLSYAVCYLTFCFCY